MNHLETVKTPLKSSLKQCKPITKYPWNIGQHKTKLDSNWQSWTITVNIGQYLLVLDDILQYMATLDNNYQYLSIFDHG